MRTYFRLFDSGPETLSQEVTRRARILGVLIRFQKPAGDRRWAAWEVDRGKGRIVRGGTGWSPRTRLTHDLAGYAVERALGLDHGFWHGIANGATFRSTNRKPTRPGRAVIAAHRQELRDHDNVTHQHWFLWERGLPTSAGRALDEVWEAWKQIPPGEWMTIEWDLPQKYARAPQRR